MTSPDLLLQLLEHVFVRDGLITVDEQADIRPANLLQEHSHARLGEIRRRDADLDRDDYLDITPPLVTKQTAN